MFALMKIELKKNNIQKYIKIAVIISIIMLGFLYLFAYVPKFDPNDRDLEIFAGYDHIVQLFSVINMTVFCVLSSVVYTKFVVEEYMGKRAILLFSYPTNRKKMFISKIIIVSLFTIIAMIICNLIAFLIFGFTEMISPIVNDHFTIQVITKMLKTTIIMAISAAALSIIAMGIGFLQKSIASTIISAFLLCSLLCNVVASTLTSVTPIILFMTITILASIIISQIVLKKINNAEV